MDNELKKILSSPSDCNLGSLRDAARRYPYFTVPGIIALLYHDDELSNKEREEIKMHLAIASGDRKALYEAANEEGHSFEGFYPPEKQAAPITTTNAIDTFFANYGTVNQEENDLLERLIFNPVGDYSEILAKEEPAPDTNAAPEGSLESMMDAFIRDHQPTPPRSITPAPIPMPEVPIEAPAPKAQTVSTPADDSLLSESLAKIFIKQGRYERAYEIISNLSLNYPKKSIYFADQLRFLQKLIKIKQSKQAATR